MDLISYIEELSHGKDKLSVESDDLYSRLTLALKDRRKFKRQVKAEENYFRDTFLNNGQQGGWDAAAELLKQVNNDLEHHLGLDVSNLDVRIQAYADFEGLSKRCINNGWMKGDANIVRFAHGVTGANPLIDFVDVGPGKEQAAHKYKEQFKFYIEIPQCEHVLLGIAHDFGYITFLRPFAEDSAIWDRITLLETYRLHPDFKTLDFKRRIQLPTVFTHQSPPIVQRFRESTQSTTTG
ncbi:MAG: hypothetical protein Q9199_003091 [Rusavskia elegans]